MKLEQNTVKVGNFFMCIIQFLRFKIKMLSMPNFYNIIQIYNNVIIKDNNMLYFKTNNNTSNVIYSYLTSIIFL